MAGMYIVYFCEDIVMSLYSKLHRRVKRAYKKLKKSIKLDDVLKISLIISFGAGITLIHDELAMIPFLISTALIVYKLISKTNER